jgi:hypothetical protein
MKITIKKGGSEKQYPLTAMYDVTKVPFAFPWTKEQERNASIPVNSDITIENGARRIIFVDTASDITVCQKELSELARAYEITGTTVYVGVYSQNGVEHAIVAIEDM